MVEDCPIVRSVSLDVESDGKAFVWLPGQLPYFAKNASDIKVVCSEENKLYAHRVEENVPIFRSTVQYSQGMAVRVASESAADSTRVEPPASVPEPADAPASSSVAPAPPPSVAEAPKEAPSHIERVRVEASSQPHQLRHFPKNPFCDICNRVKLYAKRVRSKMIEPIDLPEPAAFGQQLALDHSSSNKEFVVLLVRDIFSKVLQAYPSTTKNSDHVYQSLNRFVGVALAKNPELIVKSDQAPEILKAVHDLGWVPDTSLPARWPHNSTLERDMRSFEETAGMLPLPCRYPVDLGRLQRVPNLVGKPLPVGSQQHRQPHALPCLPIDIAMCEAEVDQVPVLGGVHKLLDRKEWSGNPGALAAVQSEKAGILAEGTSVSSPMKNSWPGQSAKRLKSMLDH